MPTAFLRKSFKTVCVDTVLFFAMFALVGHITINYWERYTIQNELYSMKHSLYTLKDTIGNIGKAYDSLHNELKVLVFEVEKNQIDTPECRQKAELEAKYVV
ncbi:hypothetical protein PYW08_016680 [Mythimna loreyi]|uniref:Uncharacterized protein n=1 Tax=Mythimna loreyi TaxID=667449 RepID=A0ACC2R0E0_9NEOP|nr:hypothetical protein PYW08_016680 [Mythimna loreyi]